MFSLPFVHRRLMGPDFVCALHWSLVEIVEDICKIVGFIHNPKFNFLACTLFLEALRCPYLKSTWFNFWESLQYLEVFFYYIKKLICKVVLFLNDSANASTQLPRTICAVSVRVHLWLVDQWHTVISLICSLTSCCLCVQTVHCIVKT